MRIALIADSHVSPRAPDCVQNWCAASGVVAQAAPDFTVHLGDITLDGERNPEELSFARELIDQWPTSMRCVPGNHDMGNGCGEEPLSDTHLGRYVAAVGADRWVSHHEGWSLFGVNAQLLGSGTPAEAAQWAWLDEQADALAGDARSIVFVHRPLLRAEADNSIRGGRYIAPGSARRLLDGPLRRSLRLVASGHTHQALDYPRDGVRHVWVPSCAFVFPDSRQPRIGEKRVGLGLLTLGSGEAHYELLSTPALRQHDVTQLPFFAALAAGR